MADENEQLYISQFTSLLKLRLQDRGGRFDNACLMGNHVGKKAQACDFLKPVEMTEVTGRNQEIVDTEVDAESRWVTPKTFDVSCRIEHFDEIRMIADPMSQYPAIQAKAWRRKRDNSFVAALFASALAGPDGTDLVAFPSSQIISISEGSGAATGLNVDKLTVALKLGHSLEWEIEDESDEVLNMAITARQNQDLMRQIEIIHGDYTRVAEVKVVKGFLREYKGIQFHRMERLSTDPADSTIRWCPMWLTSGMYRGDWPKDIKVRILEAQKRGLPKRLYTLVTFNHVRLDEKKVIQIPCKES